MNTLATGYTPTPAPHYRGYHLSIHFGYRGKGALPCTACFTPLVTLTGQPFEAYPYWATTVWRTIYGVHRVYTYIDSCVSMYTILNLACNPLRHSLVPNCCITNHTNASLMVSRP